MATLTIAMPATTITELSTSASAVTKRGLAASWSKVDGKLVCQWFCINN